MEKKIQKKKYEIIEAQQDRAVKKIRYDSQIIILEGQRDTVRELEKRSEILLNDFVDSDNKVKQLISELDQIAQELEEKQN